MCHWITNVQFWSLYKYDDRVADKRIQFFYSRQSVQFCCRGVFELSWIWLDQYRADGVRCKHVFLPFTSQFSKQFLISLVVNSFARGGSNIFFFIFWIDFDFWTGKKWARFKGVNKRGFPEKCEENERGFRTVCTFHLLYDAKVAMYHVRK